MFIWNYCPTACGQVSQASKSFHILGPFYLCMKFRRIKCFFINHRQDLDQKKNYYKEQWARHLQIFISKTTQNASSANIAFQQSFRIMIFFKKISLICNSNHTVSLICYPLLLSPSHPSSLPQKALYRVAGKQSRNLCRHYPSHFCLN